MTYPVPQFHERRGWYVLWPDGFVSAMPDERAARCCATALTDMMMKDDAEHPSCEPLSDKCHSYGEDGDLDG